MVGTPEYSLWENAKNRAKRQGEGEQIRVKDFTYHPLMDSEDCAFRIEGKRRTHHRCVRSGRVEIEGYRFCVRHAEIVRNAVRGD